LFWLGQCNKGPVIYWRERAGENGGRIIIFYVVEREK
jgi:hypothetical protein